MNVELFYIPDGLSGMHIISEFNKHRFKIDFKEILTQKGLIQPANVVWFKTLKPEYRVSSDKWYANAKKSSADGVQIDGPTYIEMVEWISEIWDKLGRDEIKKSFKCTGYTSSNQTDYHPMLLDLLTNNTIPSSHEVEFSDDEEDGMLNGESLSDESDNEGDSQGAIEIGMHESITAPLQAYQASLTAINHNFPAPPQAYSNDMYARGVNHLPANIPHGFLHCPPQQQQQNFQYRPQQFYTTTQQHK
jgi:hypothetical protein